MRQKTLADGGFDRYREKTRKEQFLSEMERIIPWQQVGPRGTVEGRDPNPGMLAVVREAAPLMWLNDLGHSDGWYRTTNNNRDVQ